MKAVFDPAFGSQGRGATVVTEPSRYRRSRSQDPVATIGALTLVVGSAAAFMLASPHLIHKKLKEPIVVKLMELPDDPPAEEPEAQLDAPPPPPSQITAPPPVLLLPTPAPVAAAPPVAAPAPPSPVTAAPSAPAAAPRAAGPENAGDLSTSLVEGKPPRYPTDSRRAKEQGSVVLSLLLSIDGRVAEIGIARSSGFPRLDRAALDAVRHWRWSPTLRDGAPVMVRGTYKVDFFIEGGSGRRGRDRTGHDHDNREGSAE